MNVLPHVVDKKIGFGRIFFQNIILVVEHLGQENRQGREVNSASHIIILKL